MKEPGVIIYKCRKCGKTYNRGRIKDVDAFLADASKCTDLYDVHYCDPIRRGIADMIGAKLCPE